MDARTAQLLATLDPTGVSFLLALLGEARTEAELLAVAGEPGQPTGNRRLHKLKEAGLVAQEAGSSHAPGRRWSLTQPAETAGLIEALLALSDAIDSNDRRQRETARNKVKRARARHPGLHQVQSAKNG